jgi:hypothetical protein
LNLADSTAREVLRSSDLLLNFHYSIPERLLSLPGRTALLDIDPGLLQFWMATGQIAVPPHDAFVTIGETVGVACSKIADVGVSWTHIQPPVYLAEWPFTYRPESEALTRVSGWWGGGGKGEWITDGKRVFFENNKRVTFLEYVDLPSGTAQPLELALALGEGDEEGTEREHDDSWVPQGVDKGAVTDYVSDAIDRRMLESKGWRIRHATEVASSPEAYRAYIQQSRGEFSCAKPSCMYFQNAWVSDRTICYLASGKPVVLQDTGPSSFLPNGEGMFRFQTMEQALGALEAINVEYRRQCEAARAIAETHFDAAVVLTGLLDDILVN